MSGVGTKLEPRKRPALSFCLPIVSRLKIRSEGNSCVTFKIQNVKKLISILVDKFLYLPLVGQVKWLPFDASGASIFRRFSGLKRDLLRT
jgi:hypothetical protein